MFWKSYLEIVNEIAFYPEHHATLLLKLKSVFQSEAIDELSVLPSISFILGPVIDSCVA